MAPIRLGQIYSGNDQMVCDEFGSSCDDGRSVLVIGAGPAGLATAASLRMLGIQPRVVDKYGEAGGAYTRMYPGITLSSPTTFLSLPGMEIEKTRPYSMVPEFVRYLGRYAAAFDITPETDVVESVRRTSNGFFVRFQQQPPHEFRAVVVATGMCDHPVWPTIPGLGKDREEGPSVIHVKDWPGPDRYRGHRMLIVGGGMRAVEIAEECATAGIRTVVSSRSGRVRVLPQFPLVLLGHDARKFTFRLAKHVRFFPSLARVLCERPFTFWGIDRCYSNFRNAGIIGEARLVRRFDGTRGFFENGSWCDFDAVVCATGYGFRFPFLPAEVERWWASGYPRTRNGESRSWPGLYFVGVPCSRGLDSQFLHGIAIDAVAVARQISQRLRRFAQESRSGRVGP